MEGIQWYDDNCVQNKEKGTKGALESGSTMVIANNGNSERS